MNLKWTFLHVYISQISVSFSTFPVRRNVPSLQGFSWQKMLNYMFSETLNLVSAVPIMVTAEE